MLFRTMESMLDHPWDRRNPAIDEPARALLPADQMRAIRSTRSRRPTAFHQSNQREGHMVVRTAHPGEFEQAASPVEQFPFSRPEIAAMGIGRIAPIERPKLGSAGNQRLPSLVLRTE